jgi:hypothetical protein
LSRYRRKGKNIGPNQRVRSRLCRFPGPEGEKKLASSLIMLRCSRSSFANSYENLAVDLTVRDKLVMYWNLERRLEIEAKL